MNKIISDIKTFFETLLDSIKNDDIFDMILTWLVFIGVFIGLPIAGVIFLYSVICAIPYIIICMFLCVLSVLIPLFIRCIYEVVKKIKKAKIK